MPRSKKEWRANRRKSGLCVDCGLKSDNHRCETCKTVVNNRLRSIREAQKSKVLRHYGGKCSCCSENVAAFLTVDHIEPLPNSSKRLSSEHGAGLYAKIIRSNFPPDYQILCWNCNFLKAFASRRKEVVSNVAAATRKLRDVIVEAYGSRCVCCGITETMVLTIDHRHSNGNEERRSFGNNYHRKLYKHIIERGFPDDYRLLCFNCNCGREIS